MANTDEYDFFVSYARKDNANGWIDHFIEGLKMVPGSRTDWLKSDNQESPAELS